jgi:hypothetical protein
MVRKVDVSAMNRMRTFADYEKLAEDEAKANYVLGQEMKFKQQQSDMLQKKFELEAAEFEENKQRTQSGMFGGNSIEAQMANAMLKQGYKPEDVARMYYTKTVTTPGGGLMAVGPEARGLPSSPGGGMQAPARSDVPEPMRPDQFPEGSKIDVGAVKDAVDSAINGGAPSTATVPNNPPGVTTLLKPNTTQNTAGENRKLSSTEQKEFYEAQDLANAGPNILSAIDEALKLNEKAYSGATANERAWLNSNVANMFGKESEGANATVQLKNIVTDQALQNLKLIFGAMPTEGERKILLEMQASTEKTPKQRADILLRAKQMAERRIKAAEEKMRGIASGEVYNLNGDSTVNSPMVAPQAPAQIDNDLMQFMTPEERALFQ